MIKEDCYYCEGTGQVPLGAMCPNCEIGQAMQKGFDKAKGKFQAEIERLRDALEFAVHPEAPYSRDQLTLANRASPERTANTKDRK